MQRISNPMPIFLDRNGALLDSGNVYIGVVGEEPETNPVQVYWDSDLTIPSDQPLKTLGGYIVNGATPSYAFVAGTDFSIKISDAFNVQIFYAASRFAGSNSQPLNADLTTISEQDNTAFGLNLLTIPNAAALASATGLVASIPLSGSKAITGDLGRQGAGVYSFWNDANLTSGRRYLTQSGAADPTSQPGDIWIQWS